MILQAFSQELKTPHNQGRVPERVLFEWLCRMLLVPPAPNDLIGKILHTEIEMIDCQGFPAFEGKTDTGRILLESLYQYCRSYDHWKFSRWIHEVSASDFDLSTGT